jgi:hypothetical protein
MNFFDTVWHIYSVFILFFLGLILSTRVGRFFGVSDKMGVLIYLWHTLFCFVYCAYSLSNPADSYGYYQESLNSYGSFGVGTSFLVFITAILTNVLGLSYLGCFLVFNLIGYVGLIAYYGVLKNTTKDKSKYIQRLGLLLIFLPSVSFWSSALGKDSISFLSVGLTLWFALDPKNRLGYFIFAVICMTLVRPHISAIMIIAYTVSFVFDSRVPLLRRLILGVFSIALSLIMIPFALQYAGVGDPSSASDIQQYINGRQENNLDGGSSVDISSMSFPMQLATYLFRPLPFEANSIFALLASVENMIFIVIFVIWIYSCLKKYKPSIKSNRIFLWVYALLTWAILALTTANLGIASRQKWMFVPVLIFLTLSILGSSKQKSVTK